MIWNNERRKVSELKPAAYNPRKLSEKQLKDLTESIDRFDLVDPLVINQDGTVIGGHQRLRILKERNVEDVDVRVPAVLISPEQEKELNLRLNKSGGEFDFELLSAFDESLLKEVGFSSAEIDKILEYIPGEKDADAIPEPKESICKAGDLWQLGEHRLLCGDSTKKEDVTRLMGGKIANLVSTDPPYCVNYTGDDRPVKGKDWSNLYHEINVENPEKFLTEVFENCFENSKENAAVYVWHADKTKQILISALEKNGILIHQTIIWHKPKPIIGYSIYPRQFEPCLFGWKQGFKPTTFADYIDIGSDIWELTYDDGKRNSSGKSHPTQKPTELFERPMKAHTQRGDICLEPFAGSGKQFIAAEKNNRVCYGIEIEPHFCDVIIKRYEDYTGKKTGKII